MIKQAAGSRENAVKSRLPGSLRICTIGVVLFLLLLIALLINAPLHYDEANYLSISRNIQKLGYPVWYWNPQEPLIFKNSPPLILYFISAIQTFITRNVLAIRLIYLSVFAVPLFSVTFWVCWKNFGRVAACTSLIFLAGSGFLFEEIVQVRFDLPLATLSFFLILLFANLLKFGFSPRSIAVFAVLSFFGIWTKYQFVTVTATFILYAVLQLVRRSNGLSFSISEPNSYSRKHFQNTKILCSIHVLLLIVSLLALAIFFQKAEASVSIADQSQSSSFVETLTYNLSQRIALSQASIRELKELFQCLREVSIKVSLPIFIFLAAKLGERKISTHYPELLEILWIFTGIVILFNLLTYRMPGGGTYYMCQIAAPLACLTGYAAQELYAQSKINPSSVALLVISSFMAFSIMNVPRVTSFLGANSDLQAADALQKHLKPNEIVLLGDERQSASIPFWLDRTTHYGYLWRINPLQAEKLLTQSGEDQVAALILPKASGNSNRSEQSWRKVVQLIQREFKQFNSTKHPRYNIYIRR